MTVKDLMTAPVTTCRTTASLREAARMMLEESCGCLPAVDAHDRLAGIVTDRDVCLAFARHQNPSKAFVRDAMTSHVVFCTVDDYIERALVLMKENRVRRIPVVDKRGAVKGLISIDDVIRNTGTALGRLPAEAAVDVLRHICTPEYEMLIAR